MSKKAGIAIAAILGIIGLLVIVYRRRDNAARDSITGLDCIKVPNSFLKWSGSFERTDWGAYGAARQQHLGLDPDDEDSRHFVDGFFKAIDVEPRSNYVRHFAKEIRAYTASTSALPHWDIPQTGYMRCSDA